MAREVDRAATGGKPGADTAPPDADAFWLSKPGNPRYSPPVAPRTLGGRRT